MKVGDLVMLDHPYDSQRGTLGIILSQRIYFSDQVTFEIMWQNGSFSDGWVQGTSMLKVIS